MLDAHRQTLSQIRWADASLESVTLDYDSVVLTVAEDRGQTWRVACDGFIGQEIVGFWDETIIETVRLAEDGDLLRRAFRQLESRAQLPSGSPARNLADAFQMDVVLIDGCVFSVVAKAIRVELA
jgi:hypothetical protein